MRGSGEKEGRKEAAEVRAGPSKLLGPVWACQCYAGTSVRLLPGGAGSQEPWIQALALLPPPPNHHCDPGGSTSPSGLSFHFCKTMALALLPPPSNHHCDPGGSTFPSGLSFYFCKTKASDQRFKLQTFCLNPGTLPLYHVHPLASMLDPRAPECLFQGQRLYLYPCLLLS